MCPRLMCPWTKVLGRNVPDRCFPTLDHKQTVDNHKRYWQKLGLPGVAAQLKWHIDRIKYVQSLQSQSNLSRHNLSPLPLRGKSYGDALSKNFRSGTHRSGTNWHCTHTEILNKCTITLLKYSIFKHFYVECSVTCHPIIQYMNMCDFRQRRINVVKLTHATERNVCIWILLYYVCTMNTSKWT